MDRQAPAASAVGLQDITTAEERAAMNRILQSKLQQEIQQAGGSDDRAQAARTTNTTSLSNALQQHALAAQRRGPTHLPPSAVGPPSKRSKGMPAKQDPAHTANASPQKPPPPTGSALAHSFDYGSEPLAPSAQPNGGAGARSSGQGGPTGGVPGVMAPGPLPSKGPAPMPSNLASTAWPVLPFLESVEYAIAHADRQPLTFHRTVSRPLSDFLSAVMHSLGVQDACYTGLGTYLMRAFIADHCAGRLTVYEGLQRYAATANWQGFLIAALEYIESAGYDTTRLFKVD